MENVKRTAGGAALGLLIDALDRGHAAKEWLLGEDQRERDFPRANAILAGTLAVWTVCSFVSIHAQLVRQDRAAAWEAAQTEAAREGVLCVAGRNLGPAPWELQWEPVPEDIVQLRSEASAEEAEAEQERNEAYRQGLLCVSGRNIGPELLGTPPSPAADGADVLPATVTTTDTGDTGDAETEYTEPLDSDTIKALACAIYVGAGNCDEETQRMFGDVALNRIADNRFPDDLEAVLTQKGQFGMDAGVIWPARSAEPAEAEAVQRCYRVARELLEGYHSELYGRGYIWCAEKAQGHTQIWHGGLCFGK